MPNTKPISDVHDQISYALKEYAWESQESGMTTSPDAELKALADLLLGLPSLQEELTEEMDGSYNPIADARNQFREQIRQELAEALGVKPQEADE